MSYVIIFSIILKFAKLESNEGLLIRLVPALETITLSFDFKRRPLLFKKRLQ